MKTNHHQNNHNSTGLPELDINLNFDLGNKQPDRIIIFHLHTENQMKND